MAVFLVSESERTLIEILVYVYLIGMSAVAPGLIVDAIRDEHLTRAQRFAFPIMGVLIWPFVLYAWFGGKKP